MSTTPLQHSQAFLDLCDKAKAQVDEIGTAALAEWLANDKDFVFIDVRDQNEYDAGHIEKAQFLSKGWIEAKIHTVAPNQDSTMVLYCGGGHRSILAAKNLKDMGYNNIFSMTGGYKQWLRESRDIVAPKG